LKVRARQRLVSILVLIGIIGAGCTNDADGASDGELVDLPDDHPANLILATAPTFSEFQKPSQSRTFDSSAPRVSFGRSVS